MSVHATAPEPASAADRAGLDTGRLGRVLDVLIYIAVAIAETVLQRVQDGPAPLVVDGATVYRRVSRAVRRMIMLALKIDAPGFGDPVEPAAKRTRAGRKTEETQRPEQEEKLEKGRDPVDRLDIPYTLKNKTMDHLLLEICRDLGLPPLDGTYHWESLTPEEIAALVVDAATVLLSQAAAKRKAEAAGPAAWAARGSPMRLRKPPAGAEPRVHDG
jgi:hypothetical protein